MDALFLHADPLADLATCATFRERLGVVHRELSRRCPGIDRMAVALHDPQTDVMKTYAASPAAESPLRNYETTLDDTSSLMQAAAQGRPRVVNNLEVFAAGQGEHTRRILGHGYASSYALPILKKSSLVGFVFCNSVHKGYFRNDVLEQVEIFTHLVAQQVINDFVALNTLTAALRTAIGMVHVRDPETGRHLERMARYSRLIARELVSRDKCPYDDEHIEQLFNFAPLHDVGKLGIPDRILLKPGKLVPEERAVMDRHPIIGRQMIDTLVGNFGFEGLPYIDTLRHLVEYHHETIDGRGYPHGLSGESIPLSARIVAVSDIFDALTTARPYKEPWQNQHAFALLQLMAIDKLDKDCVTAILSRQEEIREIQSRFADLPEAA
jgi:HD-GYP domain-containing protein (c-di-GMP phosphodiesterase class II)